MFVYEMIKKRVSIFSVSVEKRQILVFLAGIDFDVDHHRRLGLGGMGEGIPGRKSCIGKGQSFILRTFSGKPIGALVFEKCWPRNV